MIHGRKPQLPSDTVKDGALRFAYRTLAAIGLKLCLIPLPGLGSGVCALSIKDKAEKILEISGQRMHRIRFTV